MSRIKLKIGIVSRMIMMIVPSNLINLTKMVLMMIVNYLLLRIKKNDIYSVYLIFLAICLSFIPTKKKKR